MGTPIRDTELSERDINVLTLYRDSKVIPNPRSDRVLEPGDKLLCFGKLESMRGMIPARTQRKRRPKVKDLDMDTVNASLNESDGEGSSDV
ncbi:cation:proton antiporter regulatory subunit [Congregibacter brevis]|uniref:cation:proton antiporter regulatory subunit n=1 Tax=Congregibacter brevis TaxID=3081201 RepID=UPI00388FDA8D